VIWSRNAKPWTKAESTRADRMALEIGCIFCWLDRGERGPCDHRHHIISGNKRMGHWYTLPCCEDDHAKCHDGTYSHAVQIDRWLKVQHALDLSDELPRSKIVPRRLPDPQTEAEVSHE
jgi:hypothetical protein